MNYEDLTRKIKKTDPEKIRENEAVFQNFYEDMQKWYQMSVAHGGTTYIFSDYDADGICSALIMKKMFPNAVVFINDRYNGGYSIRDDVPVKQHDLVIALDIGASSKDFDTIMNYNQITQIGAFIIDHHEVEEEILCEYPKLLDFKADRKEGEEVPDYCATGLAYKLYEQYLLDNERQISEKELNTVKAYACIGTIGDCVSVNSGLDDNREIILDGFEVINNAEYDSEGNLNLDETLAYLLSDNVSEMVSSREIAFNVVPVINACSRVLTEENGGQFAFDTLSLSADDPKALLGVDKMIQTNNARKEECKAIYTSDKFRKAVSDNDHNICILIDESGDIKKGYTGLIAGELAKQTGKPALCLTYDKDNGCFVGSGRNAEGYPSLLENCKINEAMTNPNYKIGGHFNAMGMSIPADRIEHYRKQVESNYKDIKREDVEKEFLTEHITVEQYRRLEPFGTGLERPILDEVIQANTKQEMGSAVNEQGVKLMARVVNDGLTYTTFSDGDKFQKGDFIHVQGELVDNTYKGKTTLQVMLTELENVTEKMKETEGITK